MVSARVQEGIENGGEGSGMEKRSQQKLEKTKEVLTGDLEKQGK